MHRQPACQGQPGCCPRRKPRRRLDSALGLYIKAIDAGAMIRCLTIIEDRDGHRWGRGGGQGAGGAECAAGRQ
eukprot:364790-Chlamydomonas_euryale.AAC.8